MEERMTGFYIKAGGVRGGLGGGAGGGGGTKCGRWNPTAEQVKVLTDLFRSGLRTPSTDQIQKISTQLSFYGKIESKNVFYWFQNHKARERQKRRKVSADGDEKDHFLVRKENEKISTTKSFTGFNYVTEPAERVIETLQLFPLNPFEDSKQEKLRFHGEDQCRDITYTFGMDHPPLDLRLSFI